MDGTLQWMKKSIFVNCPVAQLYWSQMLWSVRSEELTVRLHHVTAPVITVCVMQIAVSDLDTAGLRRRRGHTVRSRSLPRCRRSWRDRDQYSQSTSGSPAGSPACPRGRCRPSPWPAPRGPGPGGRGSSCQTGPPPAGDQSALEREVRLIRFYDSHNLTSQWKERRIAEVNCQYLWDGGNVILK